MGRAKKKRVLSRRSKIARRSKLATKRFLSERIASIDRAAYVVAKILAGEF